MQFSLLNLKKVRSNLTANESLIRNYPGRRNFIRTIGLGMLAANPLSRTIKALNDKSFIIKHNESRFTVLRNGKICWDISDDVFRKERKLIVKTGEDLYHLSAHGLRVNGTSLEMSVEADIFRDGSSWYMNIEIPEISLKQKVDFCEWLDREASISSVTDLSTRSILLSNSDKIVYEGKSEVTIDAGWKITVNSDKNIISDILGNSCRSNQIVIEPLKDKDHKFLRDVSSGSMIATIAGFNGWNNIVAGIESDGEKKLSVSAGSYGLQCLFNACRGQNNFRAVWKSRPEGTMKYIPCQGSGEEFSFPASFVYIEYKNQENPQIYLAGKLPESGQWVSGRLGSLRFTGISENPDFEAKGTGNQIISHSCRMQLNSFVPLVEGAVALPVSFKEPVEVSINSEPDESDLSLSGPHADFPPEPQDKPVRKKPESSVRISTGRNAVKMNITFNEVKLELRKAIKISLLRPEDLVQLDFEFHNFTFTNKGQSGFLQLADEKENGIVIIYFPTQHTLEEAWFEAAKVPTEGKEVPITLPARQIRAQKSRLVYELEAGSAGFPMVLDELLDWTKFSLRVHPRAWIKVPSLFKPKPFNIKPVSGNRQKKADALLDRQDTPVDYSLKLIKKKRMVSSDDYFISESATGKFLSTDRVSSLTAGFNVAGISKLPLRPGPVPSDCTSIEAPALMYISPNQVNDFSHRTDLRLKKTDPRRQSEIGINTFARVLENQTGLQAGDIAELWHTRLGVRLKDGTTSTDSLESFKTIRVLWAFEAREDYKYKAPLEKPFMTSIDASDRQILVHETSNFSEKFTPVPVPVKDLMLTTLGAYLNWHAFFKLPDEYTTFLNIIEWQHLATLGRDHYVKIVKEGYLFPFGHKAALVKVTERKFNNETRAAINRQRMYIVVLEKEVSYNRTDPDNKFIEFPFEKIAVQNDYTPDIDYPGDSKLADFGNTGKFVSMKVKTVKTTGQKENVAYNFYICVAKEKFLFDLVGTDKEGGEVKFRIPLVFVENYLGRIKENVDVLVKKYNEDADKSGLADFNNQKVAYSECLVDGDTTFETRTMIFNGQYYPAKGSADLKFHPKLHSAEVFIKQVEELTGKRDAVRIALVDDDNPGHVFASVEGARVDFSGGSDKSGGFLSPNLDITALSRLQGPTGGSMESLKNLDFDAKDFFKSATLPSAKIFGCVDIFSLLRVFNLNGSFDAYIAAVGAIRAELDNIRNEILTLENAAKKSASDMSSEIGAKKDELRAKVDQLKNALANQVPRIPNFKTYVTDSAFNAEYRWQPELQGKEIEVFPKLLSVKVKNPSTALTVTSKLEKPFDSSIPATMNGSARFEDFEVVVASMIGVGFKYLEFKTGSSHKTDVRVALYTPVPLTFQGPLSFVNSLQSIIPADGFAGNGPFIDLTPTSVTAGFTISVPSIGVGMCTIANITLGAAVILPFTGDPLLLAFNFCTRENPFLLTVSCFGGGGFFRLVTSLKQIEMVEASFEFGAAMSLDVGVASGSVSAMGGIYFKTEHTVINGYDANIIVLTGYLRLNGSLTIIGLITLSLEFYLAFTANFLSKNGKDVVDKLVGEATLKVKVEVLFFSKTVSVSVRREIQGADADPKFTDMIFPEDWEEYCLAFAE